MSDVSEGLVYAHRITADRHPQRLTWADVDAWPSERGVLWIHLDAENDTALSWKFSLSMAKAAMKTGI